MPIHDVGYRKWDGKKTPQSSRWFIIADSGFRLAFKSRWVRRILLAAWLPLIYFATTIFVAEQLMTRAMPSQKTPEEQVDDLITEQLEKIISAQEDQDDQSRQDPRIKEQFVIQMDGGPQPEIIQRLQDEIRRILAGPMVVRQARRLNEELKDTPLKERIETIKERIELPEEIKGLTETLKFVEQPSAGSIAHMMEESFPPFFGFDQLARKLDQSDDPEMTRSAIWNWMIMSFFKFPQALMLLFLVGIIAPGLISRDVRSRAFLLYFSKPIGRFEYIIGKLFIPMVFICLITTLPGLGLYAVGVLASPDLSVIQSTWDIPFRIMAASVFVVIPTASLALMLSSLTQESRYASFSWFAVWALGHGAWMTVVISQAIKFRGPPFDPVVMNSPIVMNWSPVSIYNSMVHVQSWVFGFADITDVWPGLLALAFITTFSLFVLYRRVSAPIRA